MINKKISKKAFPSNKTRWTLEENILEVLEGEGQTNT